MGPVSGHGFDSRLLHTLKPVFTGFLLFVLHFVLHMCQICVTPFQKIFFWVRCIRFIKKNKPCLVFIRIYFISKESFFKIVIYYIVYLSSTIPTYTWRLICPDGSWSFFLRGIDCSSCFCWIIKNAPANLYKFQGRDIMNSTRELLTGCGRSPVF